MRHQIPSEDLDHFPDLFSCFQGNTNSRQLAEYKRFLYRAIKTSLTQRQREMVMLRYFEGMQVQQIAEKLRVNKSTVSRTLKRAVRRLQDLAKIYFAE